MNSTCGSVCKQSNTKKHHRKKKKEKKRSNFATMPGFDFHLGVDAEQLKKNFKRCLTQGSSQVRDLSPWTKK